MLWLDLWEYENAFYESVKSSKSYVNRLGSVACLQYFSCRIPV